jgi:hypothetical protein
MNFLEELKISSPRKGNPPEKEKNQPDVLGKYLFIYMLSPF